VTNKEDNNRRDTNIKKMTESCCSKDSKPCPVGVSISLFLLKHSLIIYWSHCNIHQYYRRAHLKASAHSRSYYLLAQATHMFDYYNTRRVRRSHPNHVQLYLLDPAE